MAFGGSQRKFLLWPLATHFLNTYKYMNHGRVVSKLDQFTSNYILGCGKH